MGDHDHEEQTIGDAATGAEEHHLEEEEPGQGEDAGSDSDAAEDERSPWAE
jgi:hypothetical protein